MRIQVQDGERFNTFSHLVGTFLALCGAMLLMMNAFMKHDVSRLVTCTIYGLSTIGIYAMSTLYHSSFGIKKNLYRKLDYMGIYLKIAGNYTPYAILAIQGKQGWSVLAAVWIFAIIGITQEIIFESKRRWLSNVIYLVMSACVVPVLHVLMKAVPLYGFALIMLGFLSYLVGFYFFLNDEKIKHGHGIWHLFVMGGSFCQYLCLLIYIV
jgi:hemolysin III